MKLIFREPVDGANRYPTHYFRLGVVDDESNGKNRYINEGCTYFGKLK